MDVLIEEDLLSYQEETISVQPLSSQSTALPCEQGQFIEGELYLPLDDIEFSISSPSGATLYDAGGGPGTYSFSVECPQDGNYTILFNNHHEQMTPVEVQVKYRVR